MRTETRSDSRLFGSLLRSLLRSGIAVRFEARGRSMYPAIKDGDVVQVNPADCSDPGKVAMVATADGFRAHRIVAAGNTIITQGDCCLHPDQPANHLAGAVSIVKNEEPKPVPPQRVGTVARRWLARLRGHF